ncbi:MAG: hypothetical protein HY791_06250 [Deltaproteobacteria bacterium]|nr:hypothetical protein [Deltaproteobacteria bacterium]
MRSVRNGSIVPAVTPVPTSALLVLATSLACGSNPADEPLDSGAKADGSTNTDASSHPCVASFGDELTNGFGRIDGTLVAIVEPTDTECPLFNDDHLVLEVMMMGKVYRMVVNIVSDGRSGTDTRVRLAELDHDLPGPPWAEGWHTGLSLDYPSTLGVHSSTTSFVPFEMSALVERVADNLELGQPMSVYASSQNRPSGAHLVHRNGERDDGAIVASASTAPRFLLFAFDGQVF